MQSMLISLLRQAVCRVLPPVANFCSVLLLFFTQRKTSGVIISAAKVGRWWICSEAGRSKTEPDLGSLWHAVDEPHLLICSNQAKHDEYLTAVFETAGGVCDQCVYCTSCKSIYIFFQWFSLACDFTCMFCKVPRAGIGRSFPAPDQHGLRGQSADRRPLRRRFVPFIFLFRHVIDPFAV